MNQVPCPHCGTILEDDGSLSGQEVMCPICGQLFRMPAGEGRATEGDPHPSSVADEPTPGESTRHDGTGLDSATVSAGSPEFGLAAEGVAGRLKRRRTSRLMILILAGLILAVLALVGAMFSTQWGRKAVRELSGAAGEKNVEQWIDQLRNGRTPEARREAAESLRRLGPGAVIQALDAVVEVTGDGDSYNVAEAAMPVLVELGPEMVDTLVEGLGSERENVRVAAAYILCEIGPEARGAMGRLGDLLDDPNRWVRWFAVESLGHVGPDAAEYVDQLIPLAEHEDGQTRLRAVVALGRIGPAAKAAVPVLRRAHEKDEQAAVRRAAKVALYQVNLDEIAAEATAGATEEVQKLIGQLQKGDEFESVAAAEALSKIGPQAIDAIPALAQALQRDEKWLRAAAAETLGTMGAEAEPVVPMLRRVAEDDEPEVRAAAKKALQRIEGDHTGR